MVNLFVILVLLILLPDFIQNKTTNKKLLVLQVKKQTRWPSMFHSASGLLDYSE
jgi:uncharacterized membrane protein YobD (UPF0266 family)